MRVLLVSALAVLAACSDGGPTAPLDRHFRLAVGQTTAIQGTGLTLTFKRVSEDTRCPADVLCVVAGNAKIEIEAKLNGDPTNLVLNTPGEPTEAFVGAFRVKFAQLQPVRETGKTIDEKDYRATLLIESAGCPVEMLCAAPALKQPK